MNKVILLGREFRLGIGFLNLLIDATGKDLVMLGSEVQTSAPTIVPKMMYYSLVYAYQRENKEVNFTQDDIYDLIDENGSVNGAFWNDFLIAFGKSMNQDVPANDDKKKVENQTK
jgi:hypothetical protein